MFRDKARAKLFIKMMNQDNLTFIDQPPIQKYINIS